MKKKIVALLLILALSVCALLSGCSIVKIRNTMSAEEFKKYAQSKGYDSASTVGSSYKNEEFTTENLMCSFWVTEHVPEYYATLFEKITTDGEAWQLDYDNLTEKTVVEGTYPKLTISDADTKVVLAKIDNAMICIMAKNADAFNELDTIVKDLGF